MTTLIEVLYVALCEECRWSGEVHLVASHAVQEADHHDAEHHASER